MGVGHRPRGSENDWWRCWYLNLVANPTVTVEVGAEKYQATASVIAGAERDRLYGAQAALMPNFAEYETKTTRKIPVVTLERQR